jgi:hypothetical protein
MGLFGSFKKSTKIHHDFFGELTFLGFKDSSRNYFEGRRFFAPTQQEIELLIHADKEGPTAAQQEFYVELQSNFEEYTKRIKRLVEDEFRNWKEDFEIEDFNKEFSLVCLTIPRLEKRPLIWDMAFTTIHDKNHHVTIDFVDHEPNGILIDG